MSVRGDLLPQFTQLSDFVCNTTEGILWVSDTTVEWHIQASEQCLFMKQEAGYGVVADDDRVCRIYNWSRTAEGKGR